MRNELTMHQQQEADQSAEMSQVPVGLEVLHNVERAREFAGDLKTLVTEYPGYTIIGIVVGESGVAKKGVAAGALLDIEKDKDVQEAMADAGSQLVTTYMSTGDGLDIARALGDIPYDIPNDKLLPYHHALASRRVAQVAQWIRGNAGEIFVPDLTVEQGYRPQLVTRVAMFETIGILKAPPTLDVQLPVSLNIGSELLRLFGHDDMCLGFGVVTNSEVWKRTYALRDRLKQGGNAAEIYREYGVELDGEFTPEELARLSGSPEVMLRIRNGVNKNMLALGARKLNTIPFSSVDDLEADDNLRQSAQAGYMGWIFNEYGMGDRSRVGRNPTINSGTTTYLEKYVKSRKPDFQQIFPGIVIP